MKNKKIVKIFDLITAIGIFLGGLFMMFTAIFLKGNGAFMLLSAIIFCTFSFLRTFLPKKPLKKELDVLINDERNVTIRQIADSKTLDFFSKLSSLTVIIAMTFMYIFYKEEVALVNSFNSSFWLGCIISFSFSSIILLIIKCYYINKYSKKM